MHNVYFEDFEGLACDVADKYDSINKLEEYKDVAIIAKYEEARQIIKELMCIGYDLHSIVMHDVEYDGYEFEYIISLYDDEIWVEPMMRDSGYITDDSPIMYVLGNCSSKVIPFCKGKVIFEVTVGEEECDCDECQCACKEETKPTTSTNQNFYVNGKLVTKEEFDKKYAEFENKYMDNIRDMLLNYCEFMDEMNEWSKLFRF